MATATSDKTPVPTLASSGPLTAEETERLSRAECYLRLEDHADQRDRLATKRRADEEEKLFKELCALDLSAGNRLVERLKAFETTVAAIDLEIAQVQRFRALLQARVAAFGHEHSPSLRLALEKRLAVLTETQAREQKEADLVRHQVAELKKRIETLRATEKEDGEKRAAKAK